jgi:hypothetical protein
MFWKGCGCVPGADVCCGGDGGTGGGFVQPMSVLVEEALVEMLVSCLETVNAMSAAGPKRHCRCLDNESGCCLLLG